MPFTLAHPAIVIPLRRFCPGCFNLPALVIGSVCPDLGYFFGARRIQALSHELIGSVIFCLPISLLLIGLFYRYRLALAGKLPEVYRPRIQACCTRPPGSIAKIILSVLIGVWGHLFWDSFTHKGGWLVDHLEFLRLPVASAGYRTLRVHHLVWYLSSFVGVIWIALICQQAGEKLLPNETVVRRKGRKAILAGFFFIALGVMHHLINGMIGNLNGFGDVLKSATGGKIDIKIGKIPRLAAGGVTNGPMLALVGDNPGGREIVQPLSAYKADLNRERNAGSQSKAQQRSQGGDTWNVYQQPNQSANELAQEIGWRVRWAS